MQEGEPGNVRTMQAPKYAEIAAKVLMAVSEAVPRPLLPQERARAIRAIEAGQPRRRWRTRAYERRPAWFLISWRSVASRLFPRCLGGNGVTTHDAHPSEWVHRDSEVAGTVPEVVTGGERV